jgi:hypothetical protein
MSSGRGARRRRYQRVSADWSSKMVTAAWKMLAPDAADGETGGALLTGAGA